VDPPVLDYEAPEWRDLDRLKRAAGPRSFELAVTSPLKYFAGPVLVDSGAGDDGRRERGRVSVRALLGEGEQFGLRHAREFDVLLFFDRGHGLTGECTRCPQTFGPCPHVTMLALDIALSPAMRRALFEGKGRQEAADAAPALRAAVRVEQGFDRAIAAWIAPPVEERPIQIAATPFTQEHGVHASSYSADDGAGPTVAVQVRFVGERKQIAPRELFPATQFSPRDRRVLEHMRDRGMARKAIYASGARASLAVEAMRGHGGVYTFGYKARLDFRAPFAKPVVLHAPMAGDLGVDTLSAVWVTDEGSLCESFDEAVYIPGPFPFVWTRAGAIYRVAPGVDADFVRQLVQTPQLQLPRAKLREAGARLLHASRGRGVTMPAHEVFGLPALETPRIVLRLVGEPLDVGGDLVAIYKAGEIPLVGEGASEPPPGAEVDDGRDYATEERARLHVRDAGLLGSPEDMIPVDAPVGGDLPIAVPPERVGIFGEAAVAFWEHGMLRLRDAQDPPIDVHLTPTLAQVQIGAPIAARVRVTLEGDWLSTRLEFRTEELPVELSVVRAALARKQRWVALNDGTLARISSSIAALAEEAALVMGEADEALLPPHQLGRLDRWIEENDGRVDVAVEGLRLRLRSLAVAAEPEMPGGLEATLRPYQRAGVAWLQFLQALGAGGILADDMGLGKTLMTLTFLLRRKQDEGAAPNLVVCPTSVASNWVREAARFTPGLRVLLLHGPSRDATAIARHDLVVTTYGLLRRDIEELKGVRFRCAVLDEAQNIKNADAATTRAANQLDASMRLALSGTPVENRLRELWSLASFVNPGILGNVRAFETRFERPIVADARSPLATELRAIVRPFLLRRTKDDVLPDLPPKIEIERVVTLSDSDKRMYDALAHTLRASLRAPGERRKVDASSLEIFTALTRLRQMACDPRLIDAALATGGKKVATAFPADPPSAKREAFLDLVRELVAEGRRALVFSQFVQLLTLWRRDLDAERIAYEYLDGQTVNRDEIVQRFQHGTSPLFLISLKAGGAGLNLTAADTVIHCDPWWNPAVEDQATDRAHRIGQDKPVTVVKLVARGTIEEKILSLKEKKRALTKAVVSSDAGALDGLMEEDIQMLLGDVADSAVVHAAEAAGEGTEPPVASDLLATASAILSPEYAKLVAKTKRFLRTTGMPKPRLAAMAEVPAAFINRLAKGEPFPCSRQVADRLTQRMDEY
jgi:hypothetical protein